MTPDAAHGKGSVLTVPEKPNDVGEAISFPQNPDILLREDTIVPYIDSNPQCSLSAEQSGLFPAIP